MITIFKNTELGLRTVTEIADGCWLHMVDPTMDEIARLQRDLGIPRDFLMYPLDLDERARTEKEGDLALIVLRVPCFQGDAVDVPYTTIPLGIILVGRLIVTACRLENGVIQDMTSGRIKDLSTANRSRLILQLLLVTATRYLSYLREINKVVDALEDRLQRSMRNRELMELLKCQKSLVYFATALRSNELMMERLRKSHLFRIDSEDEDLLEDVLTENQQAIEMVGIASNILSSMMDAFASIISNNLNMVMKFLASVTIILSLPTMIASLYGMNIELPLQGFPHAFLIVLMICAAVSLVAVFIFWRKDWF